MAERTSNAGQGPVTDSADTGRDSDGDVGMPSQAVSPAVGHGSQPRGTGQNGGAGGVGRRAANAVTAGLADGESWPRGWRVKLYQLHESGTWEDLGVGHVHFVVKSDQHHMVLQAEHDDKLLLNEPLMKEDVYRRVRDTIISWAHPDTNVELALSFQEAAGCEILWDLVCQAQGLHGADGAAGSGAGTSGDEHMADEKMQSTAAEVHVELPTPRAATLDAILAIVDDSSEYPPEAIAKAMLDNNGAFLCDLVDLFDDLEFLEMKSALPTYFKIMKQITCLNNTDIIQILLADSVFTSFVGAMEYDPDLPYRPRHREYFRQHCVFKQVIPIAESTMLQRIHQTFRVQLLRDVLLPRALDDQVLNTLSSMTFVNNTNVINWLACQQGDLVQALVDAFDGRAILPEEDDEPEAATDNAVVDTLIRDRAVAPARTVYSRERADILAFLLEMCNVAKSIMPAVRVKFFQTLGSGCDKLMPYFEKVMCGPGCVNTEVLCCLEILGWLLSHRPTPVRNYIVGQASGGGGGGSVHGATGGFGRPAASASSAGTASTPAGQGGEAGGLIQLKPDHGLLMRILWCLLDAKDVGIQSQASEVVRMLVNSETMAVAEQEQFLSCFYDEYIAWLAQPFLVPAATHTGRKETVFEKTAVRLACELLGFCIKSHSYRTKYFILRNSLISRILTRVLQYREKYLVLAGIRFFRACVALKDDFYTRHITKYNLFAPVFEVFKRNGMRNNLLNSAIIELVEFVRHHQIVTLIDHIVEGFPELIEQVTYVSTFKALKEAYDRRLGAGASNSLDDSAPTANGRRRAVEHETDSSYWDDDDMVVTNHAGGQSPPRAGPRLSVSAGTLSPVTSPNSPGSPPLPSPTGDDEFIERASFLGKKEEDDDEDNGFSALLRASKKTAAPVAPKRKPLGLGGPPKPPSPGRVSFSIGGPRPRVGVKSTATTAKSTPRTISAPNLVAYGDDDDDEEEDDDDLVGPRPQPGSGSGSGAGAGAGAGAGSASPSPARTPSSKPAIVAATDDIIAAGGGAGAGAGGGAALPASHPLTGRLHDRDADTDDDASMQSTPKRRRVSMELSDDDDMFS